jgi:hypothetical protein
MAARSKQGRQGKTDLLEKTRLDPVPKRQESLPRLKQP